MTENNKNTEGTFPPNFTDMLVDVGRKLPLRFFLKGLKKIISYMKK
jgi:hypothetical protein